MSTSIIPPDGSGNGGAETPVTVDNEPSIPGSRQLVDGTNTTVDTSTPGQIKINATGGGGVTSIIAGTGISVDQATGDVTVTNTGGATPNPAVSYGIVSWSGTELTTSAQAILPPNGTNPYLMLGDFTADTGADIYIRSQTGTAALTIGVPDPTTGNANSNINLYGTTSSTISFYDGPGYIDFWNAANTVRTRITATTPTSNRTVTLPNADSVTVQPSAGSAGQYVEYIDSSGVQHLSTPSASIPNPATVGTEGSSAGTLTVAGSGASNAGRVYLTGASTSGSITLGSTSSSNHCGLELNGPNSDPPEVRFKVNDGGGGSAIARIAAHGNVAFGTSYYLYIPSRPDSTDMYIMEAKTQTPTEGNIPVARNDGSGDCYYDLVGGSPANTLQFPGDPNGSLQIPHGTTGERDSNNYSLRWNETDDCLEGYRGGYKQYQPVQNTVSSVAGSTSGNLYWSQPNISTANKTVKIRLESFNDSGETVTFDVAFTYAPAIVFNDTTVTPSSITTTDITLPSTGGAKSGWIILEGF